MKKVIILSTLLALLIGIVVGVYLEKQFPNGPEESITTLSRGTYSSIDSELQGYLLISVDNGKYTMYEESELVDEGVIMYLENNTFQLKGKKQTFMMYYEKGSYICSPTNKLKTSRFTLEHVSGAITSFHKE